MSRLFFVSALILASSAGCGGSSGPKTVPVTGTVTLDGTPVAGATVTFSPTVTDGGRTSVGVTDNEGKFSLLAAGAGAGVVPGSYMVGISKTSGAATPAAQPASQEEAMKQIQAKMGGGSNAFLPKGPVAVKDELPEMYKDPAKSGFSAEVNEDGENDFTFAMKKGG